MGMRGGDLRRFGIAVAILACAVLAGPGAARAANVVNGDFENGSLQGWQVHRLTEAGNWFAYEGGEEPIVNKRGTEPIHHPPRGRYAAIADEANPDTLVLSQNIALQPGLDHRLSLLAYYDSYKPIAVPSPDTLSVDGEALGGQANQQFRIDVMRPGAPIESIDPTDILLTVFRTQPGDPKSMGPTRLTANLSQFAGQTVRLRVATAAHEEVLAGGVDAVSIVSTVPGTSPHPGGGGGGGKHQFGIGKAIANRRNGSVVLPVRVPGPGRVAAKAAKVRQTSARAAGEQTVRLRLRPTAAARRTLGREHRLRIRVAVTYTPAGERPETVTVPVVFKLDARPRRH